MKYLFVATLQNINTLNRWQVEISVEIDFDEVECEKCCYRNAFEQALELMTDEVQLLGVDFIGC